MSNRSQRRSRANVEANSQAKSFVERLKENLENQKNKTDDKVNSQGNGINLEITKPSSQYIQPDKITWKWQHEDFSVTATYYMTIAMGSFSAGDYSVYFNLDADFLDIQLLKAFSETLVSAYNWANVWQQHMGDFFVVVAPTSVPVESEQAALDDEEEQEEQEEQEEENNESEDDHKNHVHVAPAKKVAVKKAPVKKQTRKAT